MGVQLFIPDGLEWNGRKRVPLLKGFLTLFYLPIDLAILYRLSSPLYSVDAKKKRQKTVNRYIRCSFEYLLELQSDSLIYKSLQFISFEYPLELKSDSLIYFL